MEFTPGVCTFAITAKDDSAGIKLPFGFHVEGEDRCPRNLPPELSDIAQPNGKELCLLFHAQRCYAAYFEEKACPVRRGKRAKSIMGKI